VDLHHLLLAGLPAHLTPNCGAPVQMMRLDHWLLS
jgi:hypothetical protein